MLIYNSENRRNRAFGALAALKPALHLPTALPPPQGWRRLTAPGPCAAVEPPTACWGLDLVNCISRNVAPQRTKRWLWGSYDPLLTASGFRVAANWHAAPRHTWARRMGRVPGSVSAFRAIV